MAPDKESRYPVVLVVDDETTIADTLSIILTQSGYSVITAYDGETALYAALNRPPELLISDVVLPGLNGIELAIKIRRVFPDCKVILSSGQAQSARLLSQANKEGHEFLFLHKPVHPTTLLERVSNCLQNDAQLSTG